MNPVLTALRKIVDYAKAEPVAFQGVIQAGLALLIGFGLVSLTNEQIGLALAFSAALLGLLARRAVTPNNRVATESPNRKAGENGELVR